MKMLLWSGVFCAMAFFGCAVQQVQSPGQAGGKMHAFKAGAGGFDTKNFFFDDGEQVIVFDTQFTVDFAQKSIDYIRQRTKSPITHVVITHPNPDKFNGIETFRKIGATIIASRRTADAIAGVHAYKKYYFVEIAKMFASDSYPTPGKIDVVFDDTYTIVLKSGKKVELTELGRAGVSSNQTIGYIPSLRAFVVGDLIHHKAHAWLEGGIVSGKPVSDLGVWRNTLDVLATKARFVGQSWVYGGRGEVADTLTAIAAQKRYLRTAEKIVDDYIAGLGSRKAELQGDKAASHHKALEALFAKAFPEYGLSYMIGYGIYGLIMAKMK